MGHLGQAALAKLGTETIGVRLRGPSTSQCQDCAMAKITKQISRRPDPHKSTKPFHTIHVDWFDLEEGWDGYQSDGRIVRRCMIMTCEATGMTLAYFTTSAREDENLPIIKDAINWLHLRYSLKVSVVRSDDEMARNRTKAWLINRGISFERCAPDTHEQNGTSERLGRLIMEKARAMRFSGRLPHALWRDIVAAATYLYNRTPRYSLQWKSPYEAFHEHVMASQEVNGPRKPILHHLKAYGCKCYVLIKSKGDPDFSGKLQKLQPKAHIGFLVGYESTNIYRIWIPHKRKVISARDVIFDEGEFFDGKPTRITEELMSTLDEAIELVEVPRLPEHEDIQLLPDVENESLDSEEAPSDQTHQEEIDDNDGEMAMDKNPAPTEQTREFPIYPTPPPSVSYLSITEVSLPVRSEGVKSGKSVFAMFPKENVPDLPDPPDIEPAIIHEIQQQRSDRLI